MENQQAYPETVRVVLFNEDGWPPNGWPVPWGPWPPVPWNWWYNVNNLFDRLVKFSNKPCSVYQDAETKEYLKEYPENIKYDPLVCYVSREVFDTFCYKQNKEKTLELYKKIKYQRDVFISPKIEQKQLQQPKMQEKKEIPKPQIQQQQQQVIQKPLNQPSSSQSEVQIDSKKKDQNIESLIDRSRVDQVMSFNPQSKDELIKKYADPKEIFNPDNRLGKGGFGEVYYFEKQDGTKYAIKFVSTYTFEEFMEFQREVALFNNFQRHRNICTFRDVYAYETENKLKKIRQFTLVLVMDYAESDLSQIIEERTDKLSYQTRSNFIKICTDLVQGLAFLCYGNRISSLVHGDIKPGNILFSSGNYLVSDFGAARLIEKGKLSQISTQQRYTQCFLSPEMILRQDNDPSQKINGEKSDVFALGLSLLLDYLSLSLSDIKGSNHPTQGQKKIEDLLKNITDPFVRDTLKGMLEFDVDKRWGYLQILQQLKTAQ